MTTVVTNNSAASRYELHLDGTLVSIADYRLRSDVVDLVHVETAPAFEGRGMAAELVAGALADIRSRGLKMRPSCPYVSSYLDTHDDQRDLLAE